MNTENKNNLNKNISSENDLNKEDNSIANKIIIFILILLVIASAFTGLIYFNNRNNQNNPNISTISKNNQNTENTITIVKPNKEETIDLSSLSLQTVSGSVINGKGQEKEINSDGINLKDLLKNEKFSEVKIWADDGYNAIIKANESEKAWLTLDNSMITLVVFGDKNSKRNVKNVTRIELK